jgi:Flp pilus assembly protein TadG
VFGRLLRRDRRATVIMELALCGPPFVFGLVFLLELGYDLYAQEMLDYGMEIAARQIQLGNAQGAGTTAVFKTNYFCPAVSGLLDCNSVSINVTVVQPANSATYSDYYLYYGTPLPWKNGSAYSTANFTFCPGQPNDLMLATALYTSPNLTGLISWGAASLSPGMPTLGGQRATLSTVAFVNENFPITAAVPAGCPA